MSARRTRYFKGRLLTAEDFEREQTYLLDRSRRHNRFLHGWGIVTGLDVELVRRSREIEVAPGLAIDCAGNEIVVPSVVCVKLPAAAKELFVALSYREVEEQPIATLEPEMQMGVIRESFELALVDENPSSDHRRLGPGTPGCGDAHPIFLAALHRRRAGWTITRLKARAPAKRRKA